MVKYTVYFTLRKVFIVGATRTNYEIAVQDFKRARREAALQQLLSRVNGRSNELLAYDQIIEKLKVVDSVGRGLQEIPLDAIVGSVGRYQDFTRTFLPKKDSDEGRWAGVKTAVLDMRGWPPIDVYKIGEAYFVRDGNHRVSVARQLGNETISAYVTEIQTQVPLTLDDDPEDVILQAQYAQFLAQTRLEQLRPEADLRMTVSGEYDHLLAQIEQHRQRLAAGETAVSDAEVVAGWYDHVYLPVVQLIQRQGVLRNFPSLTETDFYVLVVEHLQQLEEALGWEVDTKTAVADLAAQEEQRKQGTLARMGDSLRQAFMPEELEEGPAPGQWRKMRWREDDWQKMRWYQNRTQWRRWDRLFADYLIPIFGDSSDWHVVDLAIKLAQREQDRLIGMHVVASEMATQSEQAQQIKTEFLRRCQEGGVYAEFVFEIDDIRVNAILRQAAWADIVMINLTRPPGVDPLSRLGSRINRLLQRCPRPVLVVPEGSRSSMSRMLLCYDGSAKADEALFVAAYLWMRWPCSLTVVTVVTENTPPETLDEARAYLEERGVDRVEYVLKEKPIAEAVLETAVAYNSNLLIMGGFGFGPVKHIMLGSTVDHLLREFKKPMLICR